MCQHPINKTKRDVLAFNNLLSHTNIIYKMLKKLPFKTVVTHSLQIIPFRQAILSTAPSNITSFDKNLNKKRLY